MGHPFDAAWEVIVQKAEYVNPASPLLGEALDRARRARPPHLANQAARKRAASNPQGHSRAQYKWLSEQGLDPKLSMEHNLKMSALLNPSLHEWPTRMNIGGSYAYDGTPVAAKLAQMKDPPSPKYSPTRPASSTGRPDFVPPFPIEIGSKSVGSPSEAEDMLFDMAAPDVYNPQNFPISPMERASMQEKASAWAKLSPFDQWASNLGPEQRGYMRSG